MRGLIQEEFHVFVASVIYGVGVRLSSHVTSTWVEPHDQQVSDECEDLK